MALNSSKAAIIDNRRLNVAQLRLRGLTQREIEHQLSLKRETLNPTTGEAWSLGTINADIKALEDEWKEAAAKETGEFKARQLAEIEAARRVAWQSKNLSEIRQLIALEMKLMGTEAPQKLQEVSWKDDIVRALIDGRIKPEDVKLAYADSPDLVAEFFARANVSA